MRPSGARNVANENTRFFACIFQQPRGDERSVDMGNTDRCGPGFGVQE